MVTEFIKQSLIVVYCSIIVVHCDIIRNEDICGHHNGRRLYLELGEQGLLYAKNMSFIRSSLKQQTTTAELRQYMTNNSHDQCSLELVTCPSCAIVLTFKSMNLPHSCSDIGIAMDSPCRCDYVWISEPPYDDISGTSFCGLYTPIVYRSSTRTVSITFLYSQSHKNAFILEYLAERNRVHLKGSDNKISKSNNETIGGILTSPFFPARYPRDLGLEYVITCPSQSPSCKVRVLFSDFQLATVSIIEFYDWNGQRLDVSSGARFRPPIIVSSGPSLLIRFYANGGTGLGYKAFYSYVIGHLYENSVQPITDCGGYVENLGGTITMMDMVNQGIKTYDCVWLIRPPKNFLHMKTHMYIKVITFANMAGNTELIIRQGPTSALLPLEILRHPAGQVQLSRMREHIAPITNGFHVSLRGAFSATSRVAIAYAAFGYMDCYSSSDFLCHNHRCIPSQLNCDGFDHCGDNSDEPATCFRTWQEEPQDRKWHINKANYYFPKIDRYPDLKTATLVFVASSLGLIILISALIILLYRMGARARQQRELQSRLQTISELLDSARIDEISVNDDPPMYEAPPGYDEVVKVGLENEISRRKRVKRKKERREPRSRSSPNQRSISLNGNIETTTPIVTNNVQRVPDSPPPPYVTPPGTLSKNSILSRNNVLHISVPVSFRGNRSRRVWQRQSSLPGPDESTSIQPSIAASIDAEAVGVYIRKYSTNMKVEACSSQPNSSVAGKNTNYVYTENSAGLDEEEIIDKNNHQQHLTCSCDGACGCANQPGVSKSSQRERYDGYCSKTDNISTILGTGKPNAHNNNFTSKPIINGPLISLTKNECRIRTTSTCSKDSYLTQLSFISPCRSLDGGLMSEFEIISADDASILSNTNDSTLFNAPVNTPKIMPHVIACQNNYRKNRHYSKCDIESLYENIKILDTFLARQNNNTATNLVGAVQTTAPLFTTPRYYTTRPERFNYQTNFFNRIRGWRSSDDAFTK
ncbi:uncharacterized protein LOC107046224 isoform X2 [Diachasma alloeum]|uniref:uncharacterized protein LOC107046224 isoform X2 n=1 Tax=Diachasma alloeum TaxID=454923 RepID=UPI0007381CA4|nr:uncharacterized protein LOC107046224 isoform X2 [Diachasma alloeum]